MAQVFGSKYVSVTGKTDTLIAVNHEHTTCRMPTWGKVALPTVVGAGIGFGGIAAASGITSLVGTTVSVSECGAVIAGALSITGAGASAFGISLVVGVPAIIGFIIGIIWACCGTQDTIIPSNTDTMDTDSNTDTIDTTSNIDTIASQQNKYANTFKSLYVFLNNCKFSKYNDMGVNPTGLKFKYTPNTGSEFEIKVWSLTDMDINDMANTKNIINIQPLDDYNADDANDRNQNKLGICIDPSSGAILSVYRNGVAAEEKTLSQAELDQLSVADAKVKEIKNSESYTKHLNSEKSGFNALNQLKQEVNENLANLDFNKEK